MIPYVVIHSMAPHNSKCWTTSMGSLEWLHYPVPLFCLAVSTCHPFPHSNHWFQVNCILLGDIVRVLCTKFRSSPDHFKTAVKAVLFLLPVFGVHYIFYVSRQAISEDCILFHEVLIYVGVGVDSLQGAIVATIFCLMNSEVRPE